MVQISVGDKIFERNVGTIDMIRYRNDKIKWEIAQKMNLGLEVGLFNIFDIQFDYFTEYRKNIFGERQTIPYEMGFSAPLYANKGEASSHGFEVQVDANHAFNKNFWWECVAISLMQQANMSM